MPLLALYAVILPSVACAVAYLLRRFPVPGTSPYALAAVGVAFAAALSVTLLVPLDIYWLYAPGGSGAQSARNTLAVAWNLCYWSTVAATVLLPLLQAYYASFEWTVWGRLSAAAHATARFYVIAAAAGAFGVGALVATRRLQPGAILGVAAAASNAYGLAGAILLLSYGLVDIPRTKWRISSTERRLASCRRAAARHAAAAEAAAAELVRAVAVARAAATLLPRRSGEELRRRCDAVLSEVSDAAAAAHDAAPLAARAAAEDEAIMDEAEEYIDDEAGLARLRGRVHVACAAFTRACAAYRRAASRGLRAADDAAAAACGGAVPSWAPFAARLPRPVCLPRRRHFALSAAPRATPSAASEARWYWRCVILPFLRRFGALAAVVASLLVVAAEAGSLASPGSTGDVSLFSRAVRGPLATRGAERAALAAALLGYITHATFHTAFKLGVFPSFHLAPAASDAPSLLAGAALLCRFAPPLALNFLALLHADALSAEDTSAAAPRRFRHTVFYEQVGAKLDAVPLLGAHAQAAFPVALLLFVAAVACNATGRVLRLFRWATDVDADREGDDCAEDAASRRGRELLEREEMNVRAGMSVGMALLSPLQGGAPDSVIAAATAATPSVQPKPVASTAPPVENVRSGAVMEALQRHSARTGGAPSRWVPRPLPPPHSPERPLLARLRQGAAAARERMAAAFRRDDGSDADGDDSARGASSDAAPLLSDEAAAGGTASSSSAGATLDAVFERMERGRGRR